MMVWVRPTLMQKQNITLFLYTFEVYSAQTKLHRVNILLPFGISIKKTVVDRKAIEEELLKILFANVIP